MRYLSMLFMGILLLATISYSQEENAIEFLPAGTWGLQFQIRTESGIWPQVSSFQGNVISGKYQFSPTTALRVGLSVSFSGALVNRENSQTGSNPEDRDYNTFGGSMEITTQYIWYLVQYEDLYFFSGLGPLIHGNYSNYGDKADTTSFKRNSFGLGIGCSGVAGIEWLCLDWLSLSAEYNSSLVYSYQRETFDETRPSFVRKQTNSSSSVSFYAREIRIGTTIYF